MQVNPASDHDPALDYTNYLPRPTAPAVTKRPPPPGGPLHRTHLGLAGREVHTPLPSISPSSRGARKDRQTCTLQERRYCAQHPHPCSKTSLQTTIAAPGMTRARHEQHRARTPCHGTRRTRYTQPTSRQSTLPSGTPQATTTLTWTPPCPRLRRRARADEHGQHSNSSTSKMAPKESPIKRTRNLA